MADTLKSSILGQFPGAILEDYSYIQKNEERPMQDRIIQRMRDAVSISSCVGIPSYKNSKGEYTNANFIQGIEKYASAMQGKEYTAVILASNISRSEIRNIRNGYENIYTELSAMATRQLAYSTNESLANALSRTKDAQTPLGQVIRQERADPKGQAQLIRKGSLTQQPTRKEPAKKMLGGRLAR